MRARFLISISAAFVARAAVSSGSYVWKNVRIGGGGGFVPNIIFNPTEKGLAYARTDIGGTYRLNPDDDSWTPLLDFADDTHWNYWGSDGLATDPVEPQNLYILAGLYTNSWDGRNGSILKSTDRGNSFTAIPLPFKVGGNMPGRGLGERLVIDPNNNNILYLGARSGKGLWKSIDAGITWTNVTSFPSVGTYAQNPSDTSGYGSDLMGIGWVTFDQASQTASGSKRIFVGVANMGSDNIFVSEDAGATWSALAGQNNTFIPHHGVLSPAENALYISYVNGIGPYDGSAGYLMKYFINNGSWVNITPATNAGFGFSGLALDLQKPGTVMVAPLNEWYPDANIFRSTNGGATWTPIFNFGYPPPNYVGTKTRFYQKDLSQAPWIADTGDQKEIGWMIQGLSINPFDSNHWLYGTGLTLYGGHDLTNWDAVPRKNVTVASLATGIEETAVNGLTSPPTGPLLVSVHSDVGGFVHIDLTTPPPTFSNPTWFGTAVDVDHAGASPANIVRLANFNSGGSSIGVSSDGGATWTPYPNVPSNAAGGKIAMSALGDTLVWTQISGLSGVQFSKNGAAFAPAAGVPSGSIIASDKLNNTVFYAASGPRFYVSTDGGATFVYTTYLGSAPGSTEIAASPFKAGEFYVSTSHGVWYSKDYGKSVIGLPGATQAWSIAAGKPKTSGAPPALFAAATVQNVSTLFRTDNLGVDWVRLTDANHGLSSAGSMVVAADPRTYSQVYVGTNGRGIFVGHV